DIARMATYCQNAGVEQIAPQPLPQGTRTGVASGPTGSVRLPVSAGTRTGRTGAQQTGRKGFETVARPNPDAMFQPGATISATRSKRPPPEDLQGQVMFSGKQSPLNPAQLPDDLFAGMKPLLEGELHDLGLGLTARITCAKNGVMLVKSSLGNGAI